MRLTQVVLVGYTILAVGAAGCGQKDEPAAPPAPVVSAPTAPVSAPVALAASLKAGPGAGTATVYLNDQKVGDYQADMQVDASQYVHPGENSLRVAWTQPADRDFTVSYALDARTPTEISKVSLNPVNTKSPGEQKVTFNLPGPDGKIPLAATAPVTATGSTPGDAPGPSPGGPAPTAGTAAEVAPAPPTEAGGSHDKQTLLVNHIYSANAAVFVNGTKVGDFTSAYVPLDIGSYVHPGANKLRVIWTKDESHVNLNGSMDVSYAATKNNFRKIGSNGLVGQKGADRTVTFNVPK